MNNQIDKLMVKAGFKMLTDGRIIPTLDHNGECGRDLQKFAELIVRECCEVLEQTQDALDRQKWPTPRGCTEYIKEHFGVNDEVVKS